MAIHLVYPAEQEIQSGEEYDSSDYNSDNTNNE